MGDVLQFERPRRTRRVASAASNVPDMERSVLAAARIGSDRRRILEAAGPLIGHWRRRYGLALMQSGLPDDPRVLSQTLLSVSRGLDSFAWQPDYREPLRIFGLYLGQPYLSWFDDGYGARMGLAVPNSVEPAALARFVRRRLTEPRLAAFD